VYESVLVVEVQVQLELLAAMVDLVLLAPLVVVLMQPMAVMEEVVLHQLV
jgi:hypothetical protein